MKSIELHFLAENNIIEGIMRNPTDEEMAAFAKFMEIRGAISVEDMCELVSVFQPGALLRVADGMNVSVGGYLAPAGGITILLRLGDLLRDVETKSVNAYHAHVRYELLHPFMDGNGRSGRILWWWMMHRDGGYNMKLGFLHNFYYQTLRNAR